MAGDLAAADRSEDVNLALFALLGLILPRYPHFLGIIIDADFQAFGSVSKNWSQTAILSQLVRPYTKSRMEQLKACESERNKTANYSQHRMLKKEHLSPEFMLCSTSNKILNVKKY